MCFPTILSLITEAVEAPVPVEDGDGEGVLGAAHGCGSCGGGGYGCGGGCGHGGCHGCH